MRQRSSNLMTRLHCFLLFVSAFGGDPPVAIEAGFRERLIKLTEELLRDSVGYLNRTKLSSGGIFKFQTDLGDPQNSITHCEETLDDKYSKEEAHGNFLSCVSGNFMSLYALCRTAPIMDSMGIDLRPWIENGISQITDPKSEFGWSWFSILPHASMIQFKNKNIGHETPMRECMLSMARCHKFVPRRSKDVWNYRFKQLVEGVVEITKTSSGIAMENVTPIEQTLWYWSFVEVFEFADDFISESLKEVFARLEKMVLTGAKTRDAYWTYASVSAIGLLATKKRSVQKLARGLLSQFFKKIEAKLPVDTYNCVVMQCLMQLVDVAKIDLGSLVTYGSKRVATGVGAYQIGSRVYTDHESVPVSSEMLQELQGAFHRDFAQNRAQGRPNTNARIDDQAHCLIALSSFLHLLNKVQGVDVPEDQVPQEIASMKDDL